MRRRNGGRVRRGGEVEEKGVLTLPSNLAIPNSAADLVSITLVLPSSPALRSRNSSTRTLGSSLPLPPLPDSAPTPGTSHNGSTHPSHSPVGEARKSAHLEVGVETSMAGEEGVEEVGEGKGKEPHATQVGLRERALILR
jgi:hypothetical protein